MNALITGFSDELEKVGTPKAAKKLWDALSPANKARLKTLGISSGTAAGVTGLLNPNTGLEDIARTGVGFGLGSMAGNALARRMGHKDIGRFIGGVAGGTAGIRIAEKKRKR